MTCDEVRELLEAYGLGALAADEYARVTAHLDGCPECRALAESYADVVQSLPDALAAASPLVLPPRLKAQVMAAIVETSPLPQPGVESQPLAPGWVSPTQPRWAGWRALGLAAAAILLIASLAFSAQLSIALAQERALRAEYAALVDQQEVVLDVVDSNKAVRRVLREATPSGNPLAPYGKIFTRSDLPHVVAMTARMPMPAPGQAYHLWLTRDGQTQLAGVLNLNDQGFGMLVFDADTNGPIYDSALVTLQAEGATAPQGPPVLVWQGTP